MIFIGAQTRIKINDSTFQCFCLRGVQKIKKIFCGKKRLAGNTSADDKSCIK